jgi:betaine-aldehyde dehydrogenase
MSHATSSNPVDDYVRGEDFSLLIGGDLCAAKSGGTLATVDPSTGAEMTAVPDAGAEDVERAVAAAEAALPQWWEMGVAGRGEVFARYAEALEANRERLAMLDAIDGGMPVAAMNTDVAISVAHVRAWPSMARFHGGRTIPASPGNLHYTSFSPFGVVGVIVPFNHPLLFAITRTIPALIAGNCVVLKPAHQTPLSSLALGEIARDVFPPGVFNVVSGGAEAGDALVVHPRVKRIAFTGSVPTGMRIQERAASAAVKYVTLELGGKNPMIVFPDVELDEAVTGALNGMNFGVCAGQSCGSNSRVFVHDDIYDEFLDRLGARVEALSLGPAYAQGTEMGPLVSRQHYERVLGLMESGREQGARLVAGGGPPQNGATPEHGFYLRPTVFGEVGAEMDIAREEIFGPVISVAPWSLYEKVIARANEIDLGLTASVWTNDLVLAHRAAEDIESGYVWINDHGPHYFGTPFGGFKNSGLGREESIEEYESYLETKVVHAILKRRPAEALAGMRRR